MAVMFASATAALTFLVQRAITHDSKRVPLSHIAAGVVALVDLVAARALFQVIVTRLLASPDGAEVSVAVTFVDIGAAPTLALVLAITVTWAALTGLSRRRVAGAG